MSNKRLIYFLLLVSFAYSLAVTGVAYAQGTTTFTLVGTVKEAAGNPVGEGAFRVEVDNGAFVPRNNGATDNEGKYGFSFLDFTGGTVNVGDVLMLTATDINTNKIAGQVTYIVTEADVNASPSGATVDITLSGISVVPDPSAIPADSISTSTVTVTVQDENGDFVTDDTLNISAESGTVGDVTNNGDGTYTVEYTAPSLELTLDTTDTLTVESTTLGETVTGGITLQVVPTVVTVSVDPNSFSADSTDTGAVQITVSRGVPVIDANIPLSLSREDGNADTGAVSDVTNNGDGTYTATYTPATTVGRVTLGATATPSNVSATAAITINAGPPENVALSAAPETVSSEGSSVITATVTDGAGNGVGGLTLNAESADGGTVGAFTETGAFGVYTAPYNAGVVDADKTEEITVSVSDTDVSGQLSLELSSIPPKEVSILVVTGTVLKQDGTGPVAGANVEVTVNGKPVQAVVTPENGSYSITFFVPIGFAARTGDLVSIVVTDDDGVERGREEFALTNDDLGDENSATIQRDVVTNIRATTSVLAVTGGVFLEDAQSPTQGGLTVQIANANQGIEETGTTEADGTYSITFFNPLAVVAETGDDLTLDVTVVSSGRVVATAVHSLSSVEVEAQRVNIDITTNLTAPPTSLIVIDGVVRNPDGGLAPGGVKVTVTLGNNPSQEVETAANGTYSATFFNPQGTVARVRDTLEVKASDLATGAAATVTVQLASNQVLAQRVMVEIDLISDNVLPEPVANVTRRFAAPGELVTFDGRRSTDNVGVGSFNWDFGDGETASGPVVEHIYPTVGRFVATLTVADGAGNEASVTVEVVIGPLRLGGLSLNTQHFRDLIDKILGQAIARTEIGQLLGGQQLIQLVRDNPEQQRALINIINSFLPPGILPEQLLLRADLPLVFGEPDHIDLENFGNALTPKPIQNLLPGLGRKSSGFERFINGDKLDLYLVVPRPDVGSVTFSLDGASQDAEQVGTGLSHTFQLEEEQAILLLPSWPGFKDDMREVFASVTLMIAGRELPPAYHDLLSQNRQVILNLGDYQQASLSPRAIDGKTVWEVQADLEPGKIYYYYYEVDLVYPIEVELADDEPYTVTRYAFPDPRNLQIEDRGIVEAIFTRDFQDAIAPILNPVVAAIAQGQNIPALNLTPETLDNILGIVTGNAQTLIDDIVTTMDPRLASILTVPLVNDAQSVWFTSFDLGNSPDGLHQVDAAAFNSAGDPIDQAILKEFTLDRTSPEAELGIAAGENVLMYERPDGTLVVAGSPADPSVAGIPKATLRVAANSLGDTSDLAGYLYQMIQYKADPDEQASETWLPMLIDPATGLSLTDSIPPELSTFLPPDLIAAGGLFPITFAAPHELDMLIRGENNDPGLIVGEFGLRAVGVDTILNISSDTPPIRLDVVTPEADAAKVTFVVIGDCNEDGDTDDPFESGSADDEMTIFSNTLNLKLTVEIIHRTAHPLTSIVVEFRSASEGAEWQEIAAINEGDLDNPVDWNVDNFDDLIAAGDRVFVRAVATNALTISDSTPSITTLLLDAGICPVDVPPEGPEPQVVAVDVIAEDLNPDSGAARGDVTINAYTETVTVPEIATLRFEIRRLQDVDWTSIGEVTESEVLDGPPVDDLEAILEDLVGTIVDGVPVVAAADSYRRWSLVFDTTTVEDTIADGITAADDENPYVARAIAIDGDGNEYEPAAGATEEFSVHNQPPLEVGTEITQVADGVGVIEADENGVFILGGIVADGVPVPTAIFTIDPAAPAARVAGVNLLVNLRNPDGTLGDAVDIGELTVTSSDGIFTVTIPDLGILGDGGEYLFQALAVDVEGTQEERDVSFAIAVNVVNFSDVLVISVDGSSVSDINAAFPDGFPVGNTFAFTLTATGVNADEIDVLVDGVSALADGLLSVTPVSLNRQSALQVVQVTFTVTVDASGLADGSHTLDGIITKRNGSVLFSLPPISVDRVAPTVTVLSPLAGHEVSALPTVRAVYSDTAGGRIEAADPAAVVFELIRLVPPNDIQIGVDSAAVLKDGTGLVYTQGEPLLGGAYRAVIRVTDIAGNTSEASSEFTVVGTLPGVSILSPLAGSISDNPQPLISAAFTGAGQLVVTLTIDGADVPVQPEMLIGNRVLYTPEPPLAEGDHAVTVQVADGDGKTAEAAVNFTVRFPAPPEDDTTPPVISQVSPLGSVIGPDVTPDVTLSFVAFDEQSGIASVSLSLDGDAAVDGATRVVSGLQPGLHTATASVTNGAGLSTQFGWSFTVLPVGVEPPEPGPDTTPPVISAVAPQGVVIGEAVTLSTVVTDEQSAITAVTIALDGGAAEAVPIANASRNVTGLADGTHTATVVATSEGGSLTHTWTFTVGPVGGGSGPSGPDTTPPEIMTTSPSGIVRDDTPRISVSAIDVSGIQSIDFRVFDSDLREIPAGAETFDGGTSAFFVPEGVLRNGTYTVAVDVTDNSGNVAKANWSFTLEADKTPPVIGLTSPQGLVRNDMTRVSVSATDDLSGIESIEIRVFDSAQRRIAGPTTFEGGTSAFFTPTNELRNDTYTVGVSVTDKSGNLATATWSFTLEADETPPVIGLASPQGLVRNDMTRVSVSATDDLSGIQNIEIRVFDSALRRIAGPTLFEGGTSAFFTPTNELRNDSYTVGVNVTDKSGNLATATWSFTVEADETPPAIGLTSPQGLVRDDMPRVSVSATDDLSGIQSIEIRVFDSGQRRIAGPTSFEGGTSAFFTPTNEMRNDTYTVGVNVTDKSGNLATATWSFTVETDNTPPVIGSTAPHGISRDERPRITVSATDDLSGIANIEIRVVNNAFERVAGPTTFEGGTFASFTPTNTLSNGTYSVGVSATDKNGNLASAGWSFTVEVDKTPPTIGSTSPQGIVRPDSPIISVSATDDLSGIANIVITVRDSTLTAIAGQTVFEGGTSANFIPTGALDFGTHFVGVKVRDKSGNLATANWSFIVESAGGTAMINPRNFPNPFASSTTIAFTLSRRSDVTVQIFDVTLRPVRVLRDEVMSAGRVTVEWDGTTVEGEDLARGVYFCQIIIQNDLKPEHAVLKMALTRAAQ